VEPGGSILADLRGAFERLDAFIEHQMQALSYPGLAIGVTDHQRLLFVGNYGWAHCEIRQPITPETLFQIGSISKSFTSIVLLQLQEQGFLSIDDSVKRYLPWFEIQSDFDPITLRHLMSHTAGIIRGADATQSAFTETWNLRDTRATAPPGEIFHYSNSGYKILGLVLQFILQQGMADIFTERILSPLGMNSTKAVISNLVRSLLAVGYEPFFDDRPLPSRGKLTPATWFETDTADGSISSNAVDMCCYLRMLLNRGGDLLSSESFDQLTQALISTRDELHGEQYGLGLCVHPMDGHQIIGHSGGMVGYTADLLADMDAGLGVIVLINGPQDPSKISHYALGLVRAALEGRELPKFPSVDPYQVANGEAYAGHYRSDDKEFTITAQGEHLYMEFEGDIVCLESRSLDRFLVPHPFFDLFLLRFARESNPEDKVNAQKFEAFHGADWYVHPRYRGERSFVIPPEWDMYTGHYRAYNPWLTNFRVLIQKNSLVIIHPTENVEEPLCQIGPNDFRVGTDPRSPEFIHFGRFIDGKAQHANYSGGGYCRIFSP
jgi:CubicO group peptidase (beta-lactamase class C family)